MFMVPVLPPNAVPLIMILCAADDPVKPWLILHAFTNDLLREP